MALTILVCGTNFKPVIQPVSRWTSVDCTLKFNDIGVGSFVAPNTPALYNAVATPNNRVTVIRNGTIFMSGPITKQGAYAWTAQDGGPGMLTCTFESNEVYLAERLTYPNPAVASTAQTTTSTYAETAANAELIMRRLVDKNIGLNSLAARRITSIFLGTLGSVGTNVNVSTRFETLTDVFRQLCLAGGGLGFRLREQAGTMQFEVYKPADKTKTVRFSRDLGNLRELTTDPACPSSTCAIVGGTGTGTTRPMIERLTVGPWRRMETFVNQSGNTDTTVLNQAGDKELADKGETVGLSATAVDTPAARYGDYQLGDKVSVQLATGTAVNDIVSAVRLTATPAGGEIVSPTIGLTDPHTDRPTVLAIRDMYRRLGLLERG